MMRCKNVVTCLLCTAFVLMFALYALYKYSLIDPEAVLYKNFLLSEDQDDYGIDVSHLRGLGNGEAADGKRETPILGGSVEQWDEIVKKDGGIRITYVTDNCDSPTAVYGIGYLMKADVGVKAVVLVNYTSDEEIAVGAGEAAIEGSFGKASLINETMELCSLDEELIQCPIKQGFREYRREVTLPKFAPKGRYRGTATLRYKGSKEPKLCARGTMIL